MLSYENLYLESIIEPMPFFSVVIPLYNKEKFIENTLNSVLNQTFEDFEVIVINDGSTDTSEEKVLNFKDKRIQYISKVNEGVSIARNTGIEKAQSNFITFLDSDDVWLPSFLEEMHKTIAKYPEQRVFSAAYEIETSRSKIPAQYSIPKSKKPQFVNYFEASSIESIIWTSCAAFHSSVFKEVGMFDPQIKISEDIDLWIRVGLKYQVVFNPKVLARYIYDDKSVSRGSEYIFEESSFNKYDPLEKTNPQLKKFLDLNRFSVAIKNKLIGDHKNFEQISSQIDLRNLNFKKRILLKLPAFALKKLIGLKSLLANIGLGNTVFR